MEVLPVQEVPSVQEAPTAMVVVRLEKAAVVVDRIRTQEVAMPCGKVSAPNTKDLEYMFDLLKRRLALALAHPQKLMDPDTTEKAPTNPWIKYFKLDHRKMHVTTRGLPSGMFPFRDEGATL